MDRGGRTTGDTAPQAGRAPTSRGRQGWLDALLDLAERSSSLVANSVLILVILVASVLFSLAVAIATSALTGWPLAEGMLRIVTVTGLVVPLLVGIPAVLFGDALVRRVQRMRADLRVALEQAQLASRAKSDFLANMSHEIRTPLNGVLGMAQVLEGTPLSPEQQAHLRIIRDSGDLLIAIIDDVLDLAKIEAGKVELQPVAAPLGASLAATVHLFGARAAEQGTRLSFEMAADAPAMVVHDTVRVRQALANLVSNAVKFTRGGRVEVRGAASPGPEGDWLIRIEVHDTGIGISPEAQGRLFRPFAQADSATGRTYGGTGLGLAISRRLARQMGGDITLSSQPGRGSVFVLSFRAGIVDPVLAMPAEPAAAGVETSGRPERGLRILVVDDSRVNRRVVQAMLKPLGALCIEAENGRTALSALETQPVDLVLLDMHMPVMDGPATLGALRGAGRPWSGVPVIALTADAMRGDRERILDLGMQGYVAKPVRLADLRAEIARALGQGPTGQPSRATGPAGPQAQPDGRDPGSPPGGLSPGTGS